MKPNKTFILRFIFAVAIIASVAISFVNKGLNHFELNQNVEVKLSGDPVDMENFVNNLSDQNIVRIDRINHRIYFENESVSDIRGNIDAANKDSKVNFSINENNYNRDEVIRNDILIIGITILTSLALYIYILLKNKKSLNTKQNLFVLMSYLEVVFFSNLFLAGLTSFISKYYQLKEIDLTAFLFMNLWLGLIFFTAILRLEPERFESISSLYAIEDFYHKRYLIILLVIMILVGVGLGVNFAILGGLIVAGVLFVSFTYYNLGSLEGFEFPTELPRMKIKRPSIPSVKNFRRNSKPSVENKVSDRSTKPSESSSKTSKKKKKKSKSKQVRR